MVSSILCSCSILRRCGLSSTNKTTFSLTFWTKHHITMNNVGLMFNIKYQSLFNIWEYKCGDVGDFANSSGKPRSCWDHRYPLCTLRNLTVSRLNCEARFSVQVTTKQTCYLRTAYICPSTYHNTDEYLQQIEKIRSAYALYVTWQVLCTFMEYYTVLWEHHAEFL
jgi:hypothetical protein